MNNNHHDKQAQRNQRIKNTLSKKTFGFLDACKQTDDDESLILALLQYFEVVTKALPELHLPVFRPAPRQGKRGLYTIKRGSYVDRILQALELITQLQHQCPEHEFNPYVESFLRSAYNNDVEGITRDQVTDLETIDRLNDFVIDVIDDISSTEFRLREQRCLENTFKNAKGLVEYIDALYEHHARLLVIRVDFGYQKRLLSDPYFELNPITVLKDKDRMIRFAKRLLGDALVGYAWKLEHGVLKSYHFHMVFFINGRDKRNDFNIGKQLGEYWLSTLTQDQGTTYNCNAKKESYSHLAIGMVHYADKTMRENLDDYVVSYLTKNDDSMRLKIKACGKKIRTFGKGDMPAERIGGRRGRPRD